MGITYTEVIADSTYNGLNDIRQSREINLKVAKPLLDAGWVIHLDDFYIYPGNNYTGLYNKHVLVLKSPDNLFSIGFDINADKIGIHIFKIHLYSYTNMPSTVVEVTTKANIKYATLTIYRHPTIIDAMCVNVGLVELMDGGFLIYLTKSPSAITYDVFKVGFGILPGLHCSSGTTINTIFVGEGVDSHNIFIYSLFYYADGEYKSEVMSTKLSICYGGATSDFEIIMPVVSYSGTFITKSFYNCTRNNPNMVQGQTILLNDKPYIVLYSNVDKSYLLAI